MSSPQLHIELAAPNFPNYLRNRHYQDDLHGVGRMSDRQASAYWDSCKKAWLAHVRKRRAIEQAEAM